MSVIAILFVALVVVVLISHVLEALRRWPQAPRVPNWLPEYGVENRVCVDGMRLRCLRAGTGRPVLLLHTLRTQSELFRSVLPDLAADAELHAIDFPGHGYSAIPERVYDPDLFLRAARGYLEQQGLEDAVVVGESIGGTVALRLAADGHPSVGAVVAINPYDYDRGRGIHRGSFLSWLVFTLTCVPVLGPTVWRFRFPGIFARVIRASVHRPGRLDQSLVRTMHDVGNRPGHYRAFVSLIRAFPRWEHERVHYPRIRCPVRFVYGEFDWSRGDERESAAALVPHAELETVPGAGHLLSFDDPAAVVANVRAVLVGGAKRD